LEVISLRGAVQPLPGHAKIESTARYLDIEVDDAIEALKKAQSETKLPGLVCARLAYAVPDA